MLYSVGDYEVIWALCGLMRVTQHPSWWVGPFKADPCPFPRMRPFRWLR
jgi:hypothetical protein